MKIEFTRSGGFAAPAMNRQVEIDTQQLPQHKAEELKKLVEDADLRGVGATGTSNPRPDEFHYQIVVEDDDGQRVTAKTSDSEMPEALSPLIDWLSKQA
jgi:hypothetical protein